MCLVTYTDGLYTERAAAQLGLFVPEDTEPCGGAESVPAEAEGGKRTEKNKTNINRAVAAGGRLSRVCAFLASTV